MSARGRGRGTGGYAKNQSQSQSSPGTAQPSAAPLATPVELAAVTETLLGYTKEAEKEIARVQRNLTSLSADDLASLVNRPEDQVAWMRDAVQENQKFLNRLQEEAKRMLGNAKPSAEKVSKRSKIYTRKPLWVLTNFMREWSEEGVEERRGSTEWVLGCLEKYVPASGSKEPPRVMFPDMRLGRLPFEAMQKGYYCEGTESDLFFITGLECLQSGHRPGEFRLQPYCLSTCNRTGPRDHVREVSVPDVEVKVSSMPHFCHGDFSTLFGQKSSAGTFDAVATVFAVDATPNILRFVRMVAHVLRPGGLWTNYGPLEYRCDETNDDDGAALIELSWEELRNAISVFFDVKEESFEDAFMATNKLSMMQTQYTVVKYVAIRKEGGTNPLGRS